MGALCHHANTLDQEERLSLAGCGQLASAMRPKPLYVPAFLLRIYEYREPMSALEALTYNLIMSERSELRTR
jgi:hypothetical protein